jgi:hypothetical protein
MTTRHSEYVRAADDFYTEPTWTVAALFHHMPLHGGVHDPCCGIGTIIDVALSRGLKATGADIADRAGGRFQVRDFLSDQSTYPNVATNPPFRLAVPIVSHALAHVAEGGYVAALVPLTFLASQRRYPLFDRPECAALVLSRRPSLPPGQLLQACGESIRGNGSTDYAWIIWQRGRLRGGAQIRWVQP